MRRGSLGNPSAVRGFFSLLGAGWVKRKRGLIQLVAVVSGHRGRPCAPILASKLAPVAFAVVLTVWMPFVRFTCYGMVDGACRRDVGGGRVTSSLSRMPLGVRLVMCHALSRLPSRVSAP